MLFNRRLQSDEAETLMDMLKAMTDRGIVNDALGLAYTRQRQTLMFLSTLDDTTVGVTCVRKDPNRMGMVLSAVAVSPEYRRTASYSIVKSSLPFFRTVAIRDVEALISPSSELHLGFPLNQALDAWTKDLLTRVGFDEECAILQAESLLGDYERSVHEMPWDKQPNLSGARELLWEEGRKQGLSTSLAWTALDFAFSMESLLTSSVNGKVVALAGVYVLDDCVVVTPALHNPQALAPARFASALENLVDDEDRSRLLLPLVGSGQTDILKTLDEEGKVTTRRAELMRKAV